MSLLFYKRPSYVDRNPGSVDPVEYERQLEKTRKTIPSDLSFEMVVSNRALPPCSLQDFMGYLLYVSHDAENLQFYLWLQDYRRRFYQASKHEQALSPPWYDETMQGQSVPFLDEGPRLTDKKMEQAFDCKVPAGSKDIPLTPMSENIPNLARNDGHMHSVEFANQQTGLKWQSFTIQPFRSEINRIISHYIAPGAPRELNLSHKHRTACLHALQHTTHPSALQIPATIATQTLRNQSHPNFVRWSTANGNRPRVLFGRILGGLNIIFGFVIAVMLLLSAASRWWRLWALPVWFLGFAFLLAGANGICLVLYVTHDRHQRPWEQFGNDSDSTLGASSVDTTPSKHSGPMGVDFEGNDDQTTLAGSDSVSDSHVGKTSSSFGTKKSSGSGAGSQHRAHFALEAFGTANGYGHEVWVDKYRAKMMIRKIFDKTVWVSNEHIRIVQDKVALQAIIWSTIVSIPLTIVFVAVPQVGALN